MKKGILILLVILTSCGSVHKVITKTDTKTETNQECVDKTITTTTEKVDTTVILKADTTVLNIGTTDTTDQVFETPEVIVTIAPEVNKHRKVTVIKKQQIVPVVINKTTEVKSDVITKTDTKTKTDIKDKVIEKTGFQLPTWIWIFLIILLFVIVIHIRYKLFS